ncbi:hypothetical protein CO659_22160 [Rhizobium sp. S9]|uniref:Uncharacterized protein n=1 Tax=Rhizobium esperanzae TaxID=1967781 RepID=A0A246E460_9HYPH|nr:hypothetical protein B5E41_01350 [Rhizobium esperanzae]PDS95718.1 hypothetical protein CO659_22160 [Rhizobium sp. S9]
MLSRFRSGEWTGKMADFSIGWQEAWTAEPPHFRFSGAILTEIPTLAEAAPLAHKGPMRGEGPSGRRQMA